MKFSQTLTGVFSLFLVIGCIAGSGCLGDTQETIEAQKDVEPKTLPSVVYLYDESSNGETYTVEQDSLIQIKLEENPGFQWEYSVDDALLAFGDTYYPSDHPGKFDEEPGYRMFELHASEPGTYTFKAVYKRFDIATPHQGELIPWHDTTGNEDTFELTFIVE